jgi:hypothetical protein
VKQSFKLILHANCIVCQPYEMFSSNLMLIDINKLQPFNFNLIFISCLIFEHNWIIELENSTQHNQYFNKLGVYFTCTHFYIEEAYFVWSQSKVWTIHQKIGSYILSLGGRCLKIIAWDIKWQFFSWEEYYWWKLQVNFEAWIWKHNNCLTHGNFLEAWTIGIPIDHISWNFGNKHFVILWLLQFVKGDFQNKMI